MSKRSEALSGAKDSKATGRGSVDRMRAKRESYSQHVGERGYALIDIIFMIGIITLLSVGGFIAYSAIVKKAKESQEMLNGETPADQSPAITEAPLAAPDLTAFWTIAGAIGGVILLILLGAALVTFLRKVEQTSIQLQKEIEAREAELQKALTVWQKFKDTHKVLSSKVLEAEMDWNMLFSYPALVDASVPSTREFHRALKAANSVSNEPPANINLSMEITELPYPKLVTAAEEAWEAAWSFAKRAGTKLIPREEQKKIDQILKLLKLAQSSSGYEHERAVAYSRAEKLIRELQFVKVPPAALQSMATEQQLMIEGGASASASSLSTAATPVEVAPDKPVKLDKRAKFRVMS